MSRGGLSKARRTSSPTIGGTYRYDALNRLAARTVTQSAAPTTVTTLYVHDLDDHIIAETDASGQTLREYIWLGDIPLAVVDKVATGAPVIYYVHADHLGRPARMTAQNQAWVWDVIYSPFGETSYIWTNPGTLDIRFPGQWFQLESGLHYNWHRHYDASIGRYLQPDPLRLDEKERETIHGLSPNVLKPSDVLTESLVRSPTSDAFTLLLSRSANGGNGRNIYSYASGNPVSRVDPMGLADINGFTDHAFTRMRERGISWGAVKDACTNPIQVLPQGDGSTLYVGSSCCVVLNPRGWVVTVW
jgi:RHS repeat-associated protein